MNKLNFMGAGPKIGIIVLPWLAVAIFLTITFKGTFAITGNDSSMLSLAGFVLLITGIVFYLVTVPSLLHGLKKTRLVKTGTFYLCCNPLYSSIILLIIPGIALMMNSWLILTTSVIAFAAFKILIKSEYEELEKFFGDDYRKYRNETPEFFPFPYKKWFRSA